MYRFINHQCQGKNDMVVEKSTTIIFGGIEISFAETEF